MNKFKQNVLCINTTLPISTADVQRRFIGTRRTVQHYEEKGLSDFTTFPYKSWLPLPGGSDSAIEGTRVPIWHFPKSTKKWFKNYTNRLLLTVHH